MKTITTLCTIYKHPDILLGMKKRGFGAGRWNGFGGKLHPGESIGDAAIREVREECGLRANRLEKVGLIEFTFEKTGDIQEVHLFLCEDFAGEPMETEEMEPRWFPIAELPYADMWPDDKFWMPLLIEGKKFQGRFIFAENGKIKKYTLKTADKI
ncbi:MAG: 8-oxo-dGTP diphosphatase [Candidatus Moranbacteria bacterium]|nr:8-oxo-dGTP diphosphatase [Candidatus Moranbacteria bacterium]